MRAVEFGFAHRTFLFYRTARLTSVEDLDLVRICENPVVGRAREVSDALDSAVVLSLRLVELNTDPDTLGEASLAEKANSSEVLRHPSDASANANLATTCRCDVKRLKRHQNEMNETRSEEEKEKEKDKDK